MSANSNKGFSADLHLSKVKGMFHTKEQQKEQPSSSSSSSSLSTSTYSDAAQKLSPQLAEPTSFSGEIQSSQSVQIVTTPVMTMVSKEGTVVSKNDKRDAFRAFFTVDIVYEILWYLDLKSLRFLDIAISEKPLRASFLSALKKMVRVGDDGPRARARTEPFLSWLAKRGVKVQKIRLKVRPNGTISQLGVNSLIAQRDNLEALNMTGNKDDNMIATIQFDQLRSIITSCKKLHTFHFNFSCFDDEMMKMISNENKNLSVLNIAETRLTDVGITYLAGMKNIQSLDISYINVVTDENMQCIANSLRHLMTINISRCLKITDRGIQSLLTGCKELRILKIARNINVTNKSLELVATKLHKKLEWLDISYCPHLSDQGVQQVALKCRMLAIIDVTTCGFISQATIDSLVSTCRVKGYRPR